MKSTAKIIAASLIAVGLTGTSLAIAAQDSADTKPLHSDLSIAQVSEIALSAQQGTIEEIELENEDGKAVFEVEIRTGTGEVEVVIDAASGEVISIEQDDDDMDDDDSKG